MSKLSKFFKGLWAAPPPSPPPPVVVAPKSGRKSKLAKKPRK